MDMIRTRMGRSIMYIIKAIILESNINDDLWPKLILVIIYIQNSRPTQALKNISPYKAHFHKQLNQAYLQILGSTVYILLHEEEHLIKSEK